MRQPIYRPRRHPGRVYDAATGRTTNAYAVVFYGPRTTNPRVRIQLPGLWTRETARRIAHHLNLPT